MVKKSKKQKLDYGVTMDQMRAALTPGGAEINNPKPMAVTVTPKPESMDQKVRRMIQQSLADKEIVSGHETYDEANDFEVEDDFDDEVLSSPYTLMDEEFLQPKPDAEGSPEAEPEAKEKVPQSGSVEEEVPAEVEKEVDNKTELSST